MSDKIIFRTHEKKLLECLIYLAYKFRNTLTPLQAHSILFLAERAHMLDWGRPIFGDVYVTMRDMPFGLLLNDILNGNYISYNIAMDISKSVKVSSITNNEFCIRPLRETDMNFLSISDIGCIDKMIALENEKKLDSLLQDVLMKLKYRQVIGYEELIPVDYDNREGLIENLRDFSIFGVF